MASCRIVLGFSNAGHRRSGIPVGGLSLALVVACFLGCGSKRGEITKFCDSGSPCQGIVVWGDTATLIPAAGAEWNDLLNGDLLALSSFSPSFESLRARFGPPHQMSHTQQELWVLYHLPSGSLRFGREADRSGSAVFVTWRMRFRPKRAETSEFLAAPVFECWRRVGAATSGLVVLGREGTPKLRINLDGAAIEEVSWLGLTPDNGSMSAGELQEPNTGRPDLSAVASARN